MEISSLMVIPENDHPRSTDLDWHLISNSNRSQKFKYFHLHPNSGWCFQIFLYFHSNLVKIPILTHIFQMGGSTTNKKFESQVQIWCFTYTAQLAVDFLSCESPKLTSGKRHPLWVSDPACFRSSLKTRCANDSCWLSNQGQNTSAKVSQFGFIVRSFA